MLEVNDDVAEVILDADSQFVTIIYCTGKQSRVAVTAREGYIDPDDLNSQQDFNYPEQDS